MSGLRLTEHVNNVQVFVTETPALPEVVVVAVPTEQEVVVTETVTEVLVEPEVVTTDEIGSPFGTLALDDKVVDLLVDGGINNESELRQAVADGRDLTELDGIGKVTAQKILDAINA